MSVAGGCRRYASVKQKHTARAEHGVNQGHAMNVATQRLIDAFSTYESSFGWYCLCTACGHTPSDAHLPLERLYAAHRDATRAPDLYRLVAAHWDVVTAALDMAAAKTEGERVSAHWRLQSAKAAHRNALLEFRQGLQPLLTAA
jgi:hypothetical protein